VIDLNGRKLIFANREIKDEEYKKITILLVIKLNDK